MKILAFSDMHGSKKAFKEIKKKAKAVDLILCCGDFTIFEQDIKKILSAFNDFKKPFLIIPGNHENTTILKKISSLFENIVYMDAKAFETDDLIILGGEGNGFSLIDKKFDKIAKAFSKILKTKKYKKYILITHAPPYKTKLDKLVGGYCGNKSIRNFILATDPNLAISGHIHENAGQKDTLGKTKLLNPRPTGTIFNI